MDIPWYFSLHSNIPVAACYFYGTRLPADKDTFPTDFFREHIKRDLKNIPQLDRFLSFIYILAYILKTLRFRHYCAHFSADDNQYLLDIHHLKTL